jgi:hypothetical protein
MATDAVVIPPNQRSDGGFTLAGFLIIAALGASLWKGAPLESVRPTGNSVASYEMQQARQVPARLWQDPFKAVDAHVSAIADDSTPMRFIELPDAYLEALLGQEGDVAAQEATVAPAVELDILAVMLSPGSYPELEERRRRRRYAVLAGLGEESFVPENPEAIGAFYLRDAPEVDNDRWEACAAADASDPGCFYVPYEWYAYEDPQSGRGVSTGAPVPEKRVLVLWLDESHFVQRLLPRTRDVVAAALGGTAERRDLEVRFTLLGPARSDALRNLVNVDTQDAQFTEFGEWLQGCSAAAAQGRPPLAAFNVYSPAATVDDSQLVMPGTSPRGADQRSGGNDPRGHSTTPLEAVAGALRKLCPDQRGQLPELRFLRTIQSDGVLIERLVKELKDNHRVTPAEHHVVLISEWDTYFGRSLPRMFSDTFSVGEGAGAAFEDECRATRRWAPETCAAGPTLRYAYLRGIDGVVPGERSSAAGSSSAQVTSADSVIAQSDLRRPVGTGQFDYLRRLASAIRAQDQTLRLKTGTGIRAVVLLGSDVYDKLLILRALRPELPGALFITTDLDAQFLHPSEYRWARGLLVATTYGLATSEALPMQTMPFRDSYQTSTYLATRLAFMDETQRPDNQEDMYARIPPLLFEVGRRGLVPLTLAGDPVVAEVPWYQGAWSALRAAPPEPRLTGSEAATRLWNKDAVDRPAPAIGLGVLAMALLALFALDQLRPNSGRVVVVIGGMLLGLTVLWALILWQTRGGLGEPIDFMSGATVWPAVIIRVLAVMLSLVFVAMVQEQLRRNWDRLGERYFGMCSGAAAEGATVGQIARQLVGSLRGVVSGRSRPGALQLLPLAVLIVLIVFQGRLLPAPYPLWLKVSILIVVFLVLITLWWLILYGKLFPNVRVRSINSFVEACPSDSAAKKVWEEYGAYGASEHRLLRTVSYLLIYFAFAAMLFALLGLPNTPCRGAFACAASGLSVGVSVLGMLVLLFLVLDAARLCICWLDVMERTTLSWDDSRRRYFEQMLRVPPEHAEVWMTVHLIGERTAAVARLIYYPVIIILLMLLARSTFFDNWDFPQALAIVITVNFAIALGAVVRLNFIAKSVREAALTELREEALGGDDSHREVYAASARERQALVEQLASLRTGAFQPVWEQPPVRATLMLLGGAAVTYAEYLRPFVG